MIRDEILHKLNEEPDYIFLKRFEYSLNKLMVKYPEGVPNKIIAQALLLTEEEAEELYQKIIVKLRMALDVKLN